MLVPIGPGICMVFYAQIAWCPSKTVFFAVHLTSLLSKHQLAETMVFYAQETLNSSEPCFFTHKILSTLISCGIITSRGLCWGPP